ncbi:Nif3-like dinuclear metal center hexameric protein [Corynebacterium caspium]|uniref:Nif3-like dinuclear metal center hexameric protein n=1 Tax=Corynebacterium caspium TaxID=234828 RepID=UPI00037C8A01|nr:Putative GTP cyclohydrolase 1 type 2 [Corynebacterium caspium DSM 44850]
MKITVADIQKILDTAYPPALAESWDKVGLICGDPQALVQRVGFALEATPEVAARAVELELDMLVVHHPLFLRGTSTVATDSAKGKTIHSLIKNDIALFSAHTNADSARPGVNDKLAELVGIKPGRPIAPRILAARDKWGVQVPESHVEALKTALFNAGAGEIGDYQECAFTISGRGQFRPKAGANPHIGTSGELSQIAELRVEFIAQRQHRSNILAALRQAHPYEEPAFDILELVNDIDLETATGLGRIGYLPEPMTLAAFTQQVANALPETVWGVRAAGDPEKIVHKVAVSSGSGDGFLSDATALGADVYISSDLRHHPVDEHLRAGGCAVIDTAHWASEFPWTSQAAEIVAAKAPVETTIISLRTDPWTISSHVQ